MKLIVSTLLIFFTLGFSYAQIYVEGNTLGKEIYVDGVAGGMPTIYVNGAITNNGGEMQNDAGEIELAGDWENYPLVAGSYISNGIERFSGGSPQVIRGTMNGLVATTNQFYNLKIDQSVCFHGHIQGRLKTSLDQLNYLVYNFVYHRTVEPNC